MLRKNNIFAAVRRILILLPVLFLALGALAQGVPNVLNTGYPENGIFHGTEIENVQFQNGNLHVGIPIWSAKGRGLSTGYSFQYNNHGYQLVTHCYTGGGGFCQDTVGTDPLSPMVLKGYGPADYQFAYGVNSVFCATGIYAWTIGGFFLREPDGTKHHFAPDPVRINGSPGGCAGVNTSTVYADDGSGWTMQLDLNAGLIVSATSKNGAKITNNSTAAVPIAVGDANGNQLTLNSSTSQWTDTLSRAILTNGSYYDSTGTLQSLTVTTSNGVPTQIALPGNQGTYTFTYAPTAPSQLCQYSSADQCIESSNAGGEIESITLPTGGLISYTWGGWDQAGRTVASRTVSANGVTGTWHYQIGEPGNLIAIVTDPSGRDVKYNTLDRTTCTQYGTSGTETAQYFDGTAGASTLIKTVQTDYNCALAVINNLPSFADHIPLPIRVTTTWNQANLVSKVETDWDLKGALAGNNSSFTWSNPVERREYDWSSGSPGPLMRRTDYQYLHLQNQAYLNVNIADRPTDVKTYDGAGNLLAESTNTYDGSALTSTGTTQGSGQSCSTSSGAPGHDYCNYGTGNLVRGNVTQTSQWLNTTNTWLNTTHNYDDLGNVLSTTDPLSHTTTTGYADNWADSSCISSAVTYAFPTLITSALGQRTKIGYYTCTSLVHSTQDENDLRANPVRAGTTHTYDLLNRPLVTSFPDGGQTTLSYNDTVPMTITKTVRATPDPDIVSSVQIDGMGRTGQTHLVDPEGDVYTEITYDKFGRKSTETNPHRSAAAATDGTKQYAYDALGRLTDVTRQDGNVVHTDYSGNVTTVSDETQRQRRSTVDGLGRLIEVDEPGDSYVGAQAGGSMAINGTLQSVTISGHSATTASGSVTINGAEQRQPLDPECTIRCQFIYDAGTVTITVNGFFKQVSFGQGSNTYSIASALAGAFTNDPASPVNASSGGTNIVTLTAKAAGSAGNYSLSSSHTWDSGDFTNSSFTTSNSGSTLTNGTDAVNPTTIYDAGTVTVTVGSFQASAAYGQTTNSTASAVASALATGLSAPSSPVTASPSGSNISITYKTVGAGGNVAVTCSSSTSQGAYFSSPSFTCPGVTLSNGQDPYSSGVAHPYVTRYSYDGLGNLICAVQKGLDTSAFTTCAAAPAAWRPRSFTYDSLSRLLTAQNPESGQSSYQYDSDSNMVSKTDARGVTVNYNPSDSPIDALNRVTKKTYSNGDTAVTYSYDSGAEGVGHLTSTASGPISSAFTYDSMGRVTLETNCLPSACSSTSNQVSATYDAAGSLTSLTYPNGRKVAIGYSAAGRMVNVTLASFGGTAINAPYYTVPQSTSPTTWGYWPSGAMNRGTFGNGAIETTGYNNRLQISSIVDAKGAATLFNKTYGFYDGSGHNNGDILSINDVLSTTRNQTFTYDALNRILTGAQADSGFSITYSYDAWGNMKESGTSNFLPNYDVTNRIQSPANCNPVAQYCYDAAGDLLKDNNNHVYTYDGEARIKTVDGAATYSYGADGQRVRKDVGGASTEYIYFGGNAIAEKNPATGTWTDYIFGGKRIAKDTSNDGTGAQYYQNDHLGSARIMTDNSGTVISNCTFNPFGEQVSCSPDNPSNHYRFSGKERDTEDNLDDFGARYFSSSMGRWLTPDWSARPTTVPYAKFGDPQTLNLYGYVRNNPPANTDADGHALVDCGTLPACKWDGRPLRPGEMGYAAGPDGFANGLGAMRKPGPAQGRQPDGSYKANTRPGSELYNRVHGQTTNDPIGDGQCVTACAYFSGVTRHTDSWTPGDSILELNDTSDVGLVVASFGPNGKFKQPNADQNSAVYMGHDKNGNILVVDQWPPPNDKKYNAPFLHPLANYGSDDTAHRMENNASYYHVIVVP